MDEDFNPYVYDGNMSVEDYKLMHKLMEEDKKEKTPSTVQTSGLRTSAKQKTQREEYANENWQPIQDTDTIVSQEEFREIVTKACKTFETKLYHPCDNGLNLKVVPDLHADNIFLYLKMKDFLCEMGKVADEAYRVLKKGKFCAILMGDTRKNGMVQPLGFETMRLFELAGFKTKEIIIKEQHNCKATGFWKTNSIKHNFLLLAHEYLFVFKKG